MGLISFSVLLHYNLSPFYSPIFSGVNRIECPSWVEEKAKNFLEGLNHESYCHLPWRSNSHYFYDPIAILMDEVCKNQFQPWHDFIPHCPHLSLNIKQQVRMALIFIHISSKPSQTCYLINYKERPFNPFCKWLHWIYDFTWHLSDWLEYGR